MAEVKLTKVDCWSWYYVVTVKNCPDWTVLPVFLSVLLWSIWSCFFPLSSSFLFCSPMHTSVQACSSIPCCHWFFSALLIVHSPYFYSPPCLLVSSHLLMSVVLFSHVVWLQRKCPYKVHTKNTDLNPVGYSLSWAEGGQKRQCWLQGGQHKNLKKIEK